MALLRSSQNVELPDVYCEREKRGGGLREKGRRSNNSWVVRGAYETMIPPITGDNGWGGGRSGVVTENTKRVMERLFTSSAMMPS
eukprot:scaffold12161_cov297-Chaetoceros_neogracile.AAC.2